MFDLVVSKIHLHTDKLIAIFMLISIALVLRLVLELFGQSWIRTKAHTSTVMVLPIITYVITNLISGNIALSLGMVGALSIVRFRNPVRSPLELSVYFGAITMGIAANELLWLIFLIAGISLAILSLMLANSLSKKIFSVEFFNASFSEGNSLSSVGIVAREQIVLLDEHSLLQSKVISSDEKNVIYHLTSSNFALMKELERNIRDNPAIISVELRR